MGRRIYFCLGALRGRLGGSLGRTCWPVPGAGALAPPGGSATPPSELYALAEPVAALEAGFTRAETREATATRLPKRCAKAVSLAL